MDANIKVQRYLDDLRRDGTGSDEEKLKVVRGPGQASKDPLQFVSTRGGDNMAERARVMVTATEQQKRSREERHEKTQSRLLEEEDNWQADLDTWRRKRKTKAENTATSPTSTATPPSAYGSSVDYGIIRKNTTREEILTIRSPEDSHDSGIENRTLSHSPSTSIDFSPRSVELTSPKSLEASLPPTYAPPPPPLDQVLIPLSAPAAVATRQGSQEEPEDYPLPPTSYSSNRARISASFAAPPSRQRLEPFVAQSLKDHSEPLEKIVNADLTVELNREQKAHVSATKYPGRFVLSREGSRGAESAAPRSSYMPRSPEEKKSSVVSTVRHSFEIGVPLNGRLATSASTPNVANQPTKPVYRAVDIPFDDSAATYQPPKRDKDGLMTIVVEMAGQPVHKGFGFSVTCERRRCFVDSVIVGTPADRQGLLIGDRIESINGEAVGDKYPSAVNRLLHEAARNGEVVLRVERNHSKASFGSTPNLAVPAGTKFDQARSVFSERHTDSYAEFKRKHSKAAREKPLPREYNSLPRSSSAGYIPNDYGRSEYGRSSDYRVISLHDKTKPGKLDNFVPEVERGQEHGYNTLGTRNSYEETRTIRNYELLGQSKTEQPPATVSKNSDEQEDDTLPGKAYLRKNLRKVLKADYEEDITDYMEPSRTIYAAPDELEMTESRRDFGHTVGIFYDREGRWMERAQSEERVIPIRREYGASSREEERITESRDWRDVINQQRQAAPGRSADTRRIREATSSLSNLPDIIDKKLEEQRRLVSERSEYQYGRPEPKEVYERSEYSFYEKKYTPTYEGLKSASTLERERKSQVVEKDYGYVPTERREPDRDREVPRRQVDERREQRKEAIVREPENARDQVVAVSGKHRCAHCGEELGRGAAMIVESLNLFYHLSCFKCYVCNTPLGSGNTGADVRVRDGRLHCSSCYSSDRLQLSKV